MQKCYIRRDGTTNSFTVRHHQNFETECWCDGIVGILANKNLMNHYLVGEGDSMGFYRFGNGCGHFIRRVKCRRCPIN